MRSFLYPLLILLSWHLVQAQNRDPEAQILLDKVNDKVKSYDNIQLKFKYVLENTEENIRQETRGDIKLAGDKYILKILGITRIFDGQTLYTISPEDEEVTISSDNSEIENTISPSQMLLFYEQGYNYDLDIVQTVQGRKIQYIKLVPIDSESEIEQVLLGIDRITLHIYKLIEIGHNGTRTTLTVSAFKYNQILPENLFSFDPTKYSDYYINKLD
jgi:outer membrane lipoprotein-sorting protein